MKETAEIIREYDKLRSSGQRCALATVVGVTGSTYRRPGARMLFSEQGRLAGLINAACLESDLSQRAGNVIRSGKAELISYDTTSPEDIVFGLGLGCNGTVEILMEPDVDQSVGGKVALFKRCIEGNDTIAMATVFGVSDGTSPRHGDFIALGSGKRIARNIADAQLAKQIESDLENLNGTPSAQKTYPLGDGHVRVFLESLVPSLPLLIFGAGPDAFPVVDAAKLLGWNVTVVDHRPAYATKQYFPSADAVFCAEPDQLGGRLSVADRHVAVIMTHNFEKDRKLLRFLLPSNARYVGLLGPKSKLDTLLLDLKQEGFSPGTAQLAKLHAPIGLDIGAETPEEIALSITAEIHAFLNGRTGGPLKDRVGPIH